MSLYDDIVARLENATVLSEELDNLGFVDTGSYALNKVVSGRYNGGYAIGAITEIYGESSTAKTVFLTHAFKGAQSKGYIPVLIDSEKSYSKAFAKQLGLDPEKLIYADPATLEDCFQSIENVILKIREVDAKTPIIIGYDSIGASPSKKEFTSDEVADDPNMGGALRAKVAGICLRRINPILRQHNAALLIINQIRSKVGVMFGDPRTKAGGGKALQYYCGTCVEASTGKGDRMKDDLGNTLGIEGRIKITKNKVAIPFQECDFQLKFDIGLTKSYGLCEQAYREGKVVKPKNGWFKFPDGDKSYRKLEMDLIIQDRIENKEEGWFDESI
jgi:recombination protein RecA